MKKKNVIMVPRPNLALLDGSPQDLFGWLAARSDGGTRRSSWIGWREGLPTSHQGVKEQQKGGQVGEIMWVSCRYVCWCWGQRVGGHRSLHCATKIAKGGTEGGAT